MLSRRRFPPPGRVHLPSMVAAGPLLAAVNPTGSLYPDQLARSRRQDESDCRATKVIRHGLWPILSRTREAVNPQAASFAIMSASL